MEPLEDIIDGSLEKSKSLNLAAGRLRGLLHQNADEVLRQILPVLADVLAGSPESYSGRAPTSTGGTGDLPQTPESLFDAAKAPDYNRHAPWTGSKRLCDITSNGAKQEQTRSKPPVPAQQLAWIQVDEDEDKPLDGYADMKRVGSQATLVTVAPDEEGPSPGGNANTRGAVRFTSVREPGKGPFTPKTEGPKQVFADAAQIKAKLRANLSKKPYDVKDSYWKTGLWQKIARHNAFEYCTLAVIGVNAIWISVDTDYNTADFILGAEFVFQFAENFFCVYFSLEWLIRFMSFKYKRSGLQDSWFVFDSALVSIMVVETWLMPFLVFMSGDGGGGGGGNAGILKLLRLMRLSRMARMARLFKAFPELMIMIKGMAVAMRSVFFTLCLLFIIVYVFSIAFVQLMGPRGAMQPLSEDFDTELFSTVPGAINNLMLGGTLPDQADIINMIGNEHFVMRLMIMIFILLAALTVMNMLVGVLCEVVSVVSSVEKESLLVNFVKNQLQTLLASSGIDTDHNFMISKQEFTELLQKEEAAQALTEVGVDPVGLVDFTDVIFKDDKELSFPDFMELVLQLRGSNSSTVKDIVDLRRVVIQQVDKLQKTLTEAFMSGLNKELRQVLRQAVSEERRQVSKDLSGPDQRIHQQPKLLPNAITSDSENEFQEVHGTNQHRPMIGKNTPPPRTNSALRPDSGKRSRQPTSTAGAPMTVQVPVKMQQAGMMRSNSRPGSAGTQSSDPRGRPGSPALPAFSKNMRDDEKQYAPTGDFRNDVGRPTSANSDRRLRHGRANLLPYTDPWEESDDEKQYAPTGDFRNDLGRPHSASSERRVHLGRPRFEEKPLY